MAVLKGGKLRDSLARTRGSIFGQIAGLFGASDIDDELWDDLEALLIQADLGVDTTLSLVEAVKDRVADLAEPQWRHALGHWRETVVDGGAGGRREWVGQDDDHCQIGQLLSEARSESNASSR
jgi:hypothetical protein